MRLIQEPTVVVKDQETVTTHPAFGQIVAHRVSGQANLYGSDFTHNSSIRITISTSELHRGLSYDRHYASKELIEVEMTEAQWANFISALNVGSGPPCTISAINNNLLPGLPYPASRTKQFAGEFGKKLDGCVESLNDILGRMDEMKLPKGKTEELRKLLDKVVREIESNMPFVAKSFGEHMEEVVEKAKTEIHGYMMNAITKAGLGAIAQSNLPLQIEGIEQKGT